MFSRAAIIFGIGPHSSLLLTHPIFQFTTFTIHYSLILSLPAQNSPISQISPSLTASFFSSQTQTESAQLNSFSIIF